jgi:hypothetical protein
VADILHQENKVGRFHHTISTSERKEVRLQLTIQVHQKDTEEERLWKHRGKVNQRFINIAGKFTLGKITLYIRKA